MLPQVFVQRQDMVHPIELPDDLHPQVPGGDVIVGDVDLLMIWMWLFSWFIK